MHNEFKRLIHSATGTSEWVIAVFADVRGFTSFSTGVESSQAAVFLKRIYMKLLDNYFTNVSFFKPTGDGLLIVKSYAEETLAENLNESVELAIAAVTDFPHFCDDDPMVNFNVPAQLGVGLARGAATRLTAKRKVLDYSGRPLNLAARLMDLARPAGVVFDDSFGIDLLEDELSGQFGSQQVYIKGIAESTPIQVYYTSKSTVIPASSTRPLKKLNWQEDKFMKTAKQISESKTFRQWLTQTPTDPDLIKIHYTYPATTRSGTKRPGLVNIDFVETFTYDDNLGRPAVVLDYSEISKNLRRKKVKSTWNVNLVIRYPAHKGGHAST